MNRLFGGLVVVSCLMLLASAGVGSCNDYFAERAAVSAARDAERARARAERRAAVPPRTAPTAPRARVETLELMHECWTPCSAHIAWAFKVRTDGDPYCAKWQGIATPVCYPERGDFTVPSNMRSGDQSFTSNWPDGRPIRIQVYRKVYR